MNGFDSRVSGGSGSSGSFIISKHHQAIVPQTEQHMVQVNTITYMILRDVLRLCAAVVPITFSWPLKDNM